VRAKEKSQYSKKMNGCFSRKFPKKLKPKAININVNIEKMKIIFRRACLLCRIAKNRVTMVCQIIDLDKKDSDEVSHFYEI
jgi:hypothetical protein